MADMIPVGNTNYVPPPNSGMNTLSGILGIQQQKQALISGQLGIQSQQAGLVSQQQKAKEIQSGIPLMADPVGSGLTDEEGNPTKDAYKIIKQAMPLTGDEHYKDMLSNATANIQYKNSWMNLRKDARSDVSARLAGVAADPQNGLPEYNDALDNIEKDYEGTPAESQIKTLTSVSRDAINKAAKTYGLPGAQKVALAFSRGGLGNAGITGPSGVATPQSATIDTGANIQPGVTAPPMAGGGFTPGGALIAKVTPPTVTTNATGQLVRVAPGGAGASVVPTAGGLPGQPAQDANPTQAQAIGQRAQAEAISQRVGQVQSQAANTVQAQDALSRAKAILESGESPDTGAGFANKQKLMNAMSAIGIDTKGADDMNTLAKNLARYEASRATASGLGGTDAARELAHNGSPNTQLDNKALQGIVRQSLATEKVLAGYANVQSKTNDPQQQLQNEAAFRAIPHPIETAEYMMSRNKGEAEQYLKEHGLSHADIAKSAAALKSFGAM